MSENKIQNEESKGLVLARKIGEKITIGKSVRIEILGFDKGEVRISIKAPKNIPVYRQEILDAIVKQNVSAVKQNVSTIKQALTDIKLDIKQ